jgi:uncharacterized membrane protein
MGNGTRESFLQNFRRFFLRGLAIVLPSILTIWVLTAAYVFVDDTIAEPINQGVRNLVLRFTPYPKVNEGERQLFLESMDPKARADLLSGSDPQGRLEYLTRKDALLKWWRRSPYPLDLMGVVIAVVVIYLAGGLLGSFIGWQVYSRGERLVTKVPLIRSVYPSIKQLTDFFVGQRDDTKRFKRVVAVQYQRPGIWSIGLVTGESIPTIDKAQGSVCIPVFMPSSPTMTGVLAYVPEEEILDLPLTIEQALRIIISGGVVMPASTKQQAVDLFAMTGQPAMLEQKP